MLVVVTSAPEVLELQPVMTFVAVSGIAAIANDPETTMAVAVAAAITAVMLRMLRGSRGSLLS